jgi:hypothetical protein
MALNTQESGGEASDMVSVKCSGKTVHFIKDNGLKERQKV